MREFELDERMSADSWARIETLFDEAMTQPPAQRGVWLDERTGTDDWLRRHVNRLIEQVGAPGTMAGQRASEVVQREAPMEGGASGTQIGPWRLGPSIACAEGREIYRVECTDGAFRQPAVLERIRHEAVEPIERFHEAWRSLARLDHPGIARLLEGGVDGDGRPFIVVERVEGIPLMPWCRERGASLSQRLDLFLQVCEAVAYAHRNLLVHRDLQPGKVMVTTEGRCRLLDFGKAALLRNDGLDEHRARAPMTLAYASPEHLAQAPVTPTSDVYSLGLLLFELLTGERPWHRFQSSLPLMIERQLRAEPPSPSSIAAARIDAPVDACGLRGDLDAIVALALQREPERRYRSAAELADDIRCHLERRPVLARPDTLACALRRFVFHHRVAATFFGIAILGLLAALAVALWQSSEAHLAAATAQRDAARATAIKDFLVDMLRARDTPIGQDRPRDQITTRELLDLAVPKIGERFRDDPATQVELLGMIASIYRERGDEKRYHALHAQQLVQLRRLHEDTHPTVIQGLLDDAGHAGEENDDARALKLLADVDPLIRKAGLDNTVVRARWWLVRSGLSPESHTEVDPAALEKALEMYERLAPTDPGFAEGLTLLGWREMPGNPAKAEQHFLRAIAVARKNPEHDDHALSQPVWPGLAQAREDQGKYDTALEAYERGAALVEKTYGLEDDRAWIPAAQYAGALHRDGQRVLALAQFERLMAIMPASWNGSSADDDVRELYADRLAAEGRPRDAISLLEAALGEYRKKPGSEHERHRALLILGDAYDRAGMSSKARDAIKASLDGCLQEDPQGSSAVSRARERWGRFLLTHDDLPAAQLQFDEVLARTEGRDNEMAALAHGGLAQLSQQRGDWDAALASSTHAVVGFENIVGQRDLRTGPHLWLIHAESLRRVEDHASARIWAERALEASKQYDAPGAPSIREAERMLARIP